MLLPVCCVINLPSLRSEAGPSLQLPGIRLGTPRSWVWDLGTLLSVLFLSNYPSSPKGGWHSPCGWGQSPFLRPLSPNVSWVLPTKLWAALAPQGSAGGLLCSLAGNSISSPAPALGSSLRWAPPLGAPAPVLAGLWGGNLNTLEPDARLSVYFCGFLFELFPAGRLNDTGRGRGQGRAHSTSAGGPGHTRASSEGPSGGSCP